MTPALDLTRGGVRGKPLCIDLFCGLFGWSSGFVAEGWDVIGFDLEDMHANFGLIRPPEFRLVIQNVLTLHGSQFRNADCLVASPPCQAYSYMAMPFSRGKAKAAAIRADTAGAELGRLNQLFDACFRIQREASEAAGRHIPMVVENVRGAIPWVGPARWNYGSFYLFGDVPALMPATTRGVKGRPYETGNKNDGGSWFNVAHNTTSGVGQNPDGRKLAGFRFDGSGRSFQSASVEHALSGQKGVGPKWDAEKGCGAHGMARWTNPAEGRKGAGAGAEWFDQNLCRLPSKSPKRKAASALIAKIPMALSTWIARCFLPRESEAA